ncbi:phosphatidylcholine/phosphatidylserine synthase [Gordonia sp. LSe1-13]|uniref:Phosphatidylcholine/phosphatidylserine synthase n=1 Tax=Gordonia sesuvii TaxID=3116777 RepID=A0ABU7M9U9_9ACTN|nr:phosphatidylcholine/phosphatidylserine synthase [Gordonia sp. LSe1-13]
MATTRRPERPTSHRTPTTHPTRGTRTTVTTAAQPERNRLRGPAAAGRLFVPSALTILAICAGLTAIRVADGGQIDLAMALVVAAALLDGIDGRVARMMGATTRIGAEIDSLADAINFGVVPALIVYLTLTPDKDIGWAFALIYCCAIVLRLARFNTIIDDEEAPGYTRDFFVGVPAPAAAIIALLPVGLSQQFGSGWWTSLPVVGGWLVFVAFLAVSRIPTASLKTTSIPPRALAGLLILVAIGAALLLTFPYTLMMIAIAAYLLHIPFAWRNQRWVASRPEHWEAHPSERRAERRADARAQPRRPRLTPASRSQARLGLRRPTGGEAGGTDRPGPEPTTEESRR